ncbi:MAG: thiamine phosphate synthase [bacterium]|nr:thiamine phosphate synthase [bacterium]
MSINRFQLIVISPETEVPNEIETVNALFEAGLDIFHLRKPGWTDDQFDSWVNAIPNGYKSKVTVHERLDIAEKWNLGGIHLKSNQTEVVTGIERRSKSSHGLKEFTSEEFKDFDYITFSPVFRSISKTDYSPEFSLDSIQQCLEEKTVPVIALGGVEMNNLSQLKSMGFDGAAMLGSFWLVENIVERVAYFEECKRILE